MSSQSLAFGFVLCACLVGQPAWATETLFKRQGPLSFVIGDTPSKSQVVFLSDAPLEKVRGTAEGITGSVRLTDASDLATTTARISVPVASMRTGNPMRDKHLVSDEWLDAAKFPNITFELASVDGVRMEGDHAAVTVHGAITINGTSKTLAAPAQIAFRGDKNILKITTKFNVTLRDFHIKGQVGMIGSKVGETVQVEGTFYGVGK